MSSRNQGPVFETEAWRATTFLRLLLSTVYLDVWLWERFERLRSEQGLVQHLLEGLLNVLASQSRCFEEEHVEFGCSSFGSSCRHSSACTSILLSKVFFIADQHAHNIRISVL